MKIPKNMIHELMKKDPAFRQLMEEIYGYQISEDLMQRKDETVPDKKCAGIGYCWNTDCDEDHCRCHDNCSHPL